MKEKVIAVVGQTASGKSDLGVVLAKTFSGEVVSADSRQVYRGLDLASGKISQKEMKGVPHHLLNVSSLKRRYTIAEYQTAALRAVQDIHVRDKTPFLVGGSPLYIYAVVDGLSFPQVKPNPELRAELEQLEASELFSRLKKLDPERAASIESQNPRRLIRALEIIHETGQPVPTKSAAAPLFDTLLLGIEISPTLLEKRVSTRLQRRLRAGMIAEIQRLHASGVSYKRLEELGLEPRLIAQLLQKKISREEMEEQLMRDTLQFARRQLRWFQKDKRIHWIRSTREAEKITRAFLKG